MCVCVCVPRQMIFQPHLLLTYTDTAKECAAETGNIKVTIELVAMWQLRVLN